MWLDAYVTDFLSRARSKGFVVPDTTFRQAMDNPRNQVNYSADFDVGGEALAYALMVLAREGAVAIADLRYYADVKGQAFSTSLAAAQLGSALAFYGDPTRADAMFALAARKLAEATGAETRLWRSDYGSARRDAAGVLTLAVEAGSKAVDQVALAERIAGQQKGRTRSTQEAMWSLLAANALIEDPNMQGMTVNGTPATGPLVRVLQDEVGLQPSEIRNRTGQGQTDTLTTFGVPTEPETAGGNGYAIERAISPGTYHQPAASVDDMYRPQFCARTEPGRVPVKE